MQSENSVEKNEDLFICFIGAGAIAQTLAKGFINSKYIEPKQICASAKNLDGPNLNKFQEWGCNITPNNDFFMNIKKENHKTYVIFICIKPSNIENININKIIQSFPMEIIVVSVVAGVKLSYFYKSCHDIDNCVWARIMPNTACEINCGAIGLYFKDDYSLGRRNLLKKLLSKVGFCQEVTENEIDAICGLSGSGIAFVYSMIQAMSDGGVLMGLPRSLALDFATQTVYGAAMMVKKKNDHPIILREKVCSPGGTTITGINVLERQSFQGTIMEAIQAAVERSKNFQKNQEEFLKK